MEPDRPQGAPRTHRRLSEVLLEIAAESGERISLGDLADRIGDRSFAAMMIVFSAPNLIPMPPGASTIFSVPLIIVSAQLLFGSPRIWLPKFISARSVDRDSFGQIASRLQPWLTRFERIARPRYWPASRVLADRYVGFMVLLLGIVLVLPIPFGNWLPALAVVLMSLGLAERDGMWLAGGSLIAVASIAVVIAVIEVVIAVFQVVVPVAQSVWMAVSEFVLSLVDSIITSLRLMFA